MLAGGSGSGAGLPPDVAGLVGRARESCERLVRLVEAVLATREVEADGMQRAHRAEALPPVAPPIG